MIRLNGLDFYVETEGAGPSLLLLHGFTGSVRTWDAIRHSLAARATVIALDQIGHGQSAAPADAARYTFDWTIADLSALLDQLGLDTVDVLGYSMGGRVALHFAVHCRRRVNRLILESAFPGFEDDAERQRRIRSDDELAERILRNGIPTFVEEWERQPLLALGPHVCQAVRDRQRAERMQNRPLGLANSLRGMGAGQHQPLWSRLAELTMPVQLIVGESDFRYCAIAERMRALLPRLELAIVPDAGHTVHLDQPAAFVSVVGGALDRFAGPGDRVF